MLKVENFEVLGWEHVIRGMRNPMNSWHRSDSRFQGQDGDYYNLSGDTWPSAHDEDSFYLGSNDHDLMMRLAKGGPVHGKFRRMIVVYVDITAPLYWWKEFDTYKVGTVANSCSTMHKIHAKEFTMEDFSTDHLVDDIIEAHPLSAKPVHVYNYKAFMENTIEVLNAAREWFLETGDKKYWWQMIQLLPSSYNQKRTVMLNYEVLANIYQYRRNHKLDEWHVLCDWIKSLPYSEIITCNVEDED